MIVTERARAMILNEVKNGKMSWYYVSIANIGSFLGGCFIEARGPIEAWALMHVLGIFPKGHDASTETTGPIHRNQMRQIPEDMRWRLLTKAEVERL